MNKTQQDEVEITDGGGEGGILPDEVASELRCD